VDAFTFPPAPDPKAPEWPGLPIGAGNIVTKTRTRTAVHDKTIDRIEGRRDELVSAAVEHVVRHAGKEPLALQDVVIHGVRVRAITNSRHLADFWLANWYSPDEWQAQTGLEAPAKPQVTVYALGRVADQQEAAYYSRRTNTIVFFNTSYYGQLKSWVLGAVGRVLAEDWGIHSIHGACVEKGGRGVLYIAPTGTGKSTSSYGLQATYPDTRFHSDDWVYIRYAYATRAGERIAPLEVVPAPPAGTGPRDGRASGAPVRGYRVFRWLEGHRGAAAQVRGLDLHNAERTVPLAELDLSQPPEAYAYTSEKIFYLRTNLVGNFPLSAHEMLRSPLENIPEVGETFMDRHGAQLDALVDDILAVTGGDDEYARDAAAHLGAMPRAELRRLLARLIAFDNGRAMLDITRILPAARVVTNPMEPTPLSSVILLKRDPRDRTVLETLSLGAFMGRLLLGETPDRKREIAYNAYRAVDDEAERAVIARIEGEAAREGGTPEALYAAFLKQHGLPETLAEEFELFRVLHQATRCYDLNTILATDPKVDGLKEAVARTMELIGYAIAARTGRTRLTLDDYRDVVVAARTST
jgi:hypothetical protein